MLLLCPVRQSTIINSEKNTVRFYLGAWIITSGYKEESIAELVGEVVYDCRTKNPDINFRAIAVGKWGNICDCRQMKRRFDDNVVFNILSHWYSRDPDVQPSSYKSHGRYKLESNHTHYIFFDDGTRDSLDTGAFASDLARQLSYGSKRKSQYLVEFSICTYCLNLVPLITVLAGGTLHSLPSICIDLKNHVPVVVINVSHKFSESNSLLDCSDVVRDVDHLVIYYANTWS